MLIGDIYRYKLTIIIFLNNKILNIKSIKCFKFIIVIIYE